MLEATLVFILYVSAWLLLIAMILMLIVLFGMFVYSLWELYELTKDKLSEWRKE